MSTQSCITLTRAQVGLLQLFTTVQPRTLLCVQEEPRSLHSNLVVLVRGHPVRREGEGLVLVAVAHPPQELDAGAREGEPDHIHHRQGAQDHDCHGRPEAAAALAEELVVVPVGSGSVERLLGLLELPAERAVALVEFNQARLKVGNDTLPIVNQRGCDYSRRRQLNPCGRHRRLKVHEDRLP